MNEQLSNFKVTDRNSFAVFISLLREEIIKNPDRYENNNLDDFLEAMTAYTKDLQGYYDNTKQNINADHPDWKTFADILMGSAVYE